jgi:uncharacterized protein
MDLTFILTEDCNLRCTYCYQKNFRRNDMPAEVALDALRSAVAAGERSLALTFFGGEPLLRADTMFDVLAEARQIVRAAGVRMTAKVPTNGLLLTSEIIRRAADAGLFISLSFDGVRAAQDAGRVRPDGAGSFDDALRALRLLAASGKPFGVYSVITPGNVRHLAESRQFLWDEGARLLVTAVDYTARWDEPAVRTLVEQYERVGEMYRRLLKGRRKSFHIEPLDSRIGQWTRENDWTRCVPGVRQVTVGPDGTLYGCVEFFYRRMFPLGTARGWLEDDRVKAFASQHLAGRPDECKTCGVRDRCTNTCACVNLRTTGHANRPPESVCFTEQATIQAVDRIAARLYKQRVPEFLMRHYSASYHLLSGIEKLLQDYGLEGSGDEAEGVDHERADETAGEGVGDRAEAGAGGL